MYRWSPLSTIFGTWKKSCYAKFVLVEQYKYLFLIDQVFVKSIFRTGLILTVQPNPPKRSIKAKVQTSSNEMKPDFPREYGYGNQVSASLYEIPVKYLREWSFRQCLPFSWTTLRSNHCRHPIVVMGVVDTFRQSVKKCQNLTFKVNFLHQKSSESSRVVFFH